MMRRVISQNQTAAVGAVDYSIVAGTRLVLASSALVIIFLDPSEPDRLVDLTYAALISYTVYSATLYFLAASRKPVIRKIRKWEHWADVAWYLPLIALSSGTNSIFFFFFFFPLLVASFRWGFREGLTNNGHLFRTLHHHRLSDRAGRAGVRAKPAPAAAHIPHVDRVYDGVLGRARNYAEAPAAPAKRGFLAIESALRYSAHDRQHT